MKWTFLAAGVLVVSSLAAPVICAWAQTGETIPSIETIAAHMAQARATNHGRFRPYIVTRDYAMFRKETNDAESEVTANITSVSPEEKTYTIEKSNGSGLGQKIVRRLLEGEMADARDARSTDISEDNYDFRLIRAEDVDEQRCYMLELIPKRKDKNLLRGNAWVDANTYLLRRVEGSVVKAPSWLLKDLHIELLYGDFAGMWMQTASRATANVWIIGESIMTSHDVKYEISEAAPAGWSAQAQFSGEANRKRQQRVVERAAGRKETQL
jgi:outer membrane lipoprotein-sorting protein